MKAYHVVQWEVHEKADSRKTEGGLLWYASPPKHDGLGWAYLTSQEHREALYGTWKAILDVASRGPKWMRWWLVRGNRALTAEDLAAMTKFRVESFREAFEFFCRPEVGWLEEREFDAATLAAFREATGDGRDKAGGHPGEAGDGRDKAGASPATYIHTRKDTYKEVTDQKKEAARPANGAQGLKVQWAALNDQVKVLEGKKGREGLSGEERAELRQKKAARDEVQKKQAAGDF